MAMTHLNDSSLKPTTCPVCLKEQSTVSDSTNAGVDGVFVIPGQGRLGCLILCPLYAMHVWH